MAERDRLLYTFWTQLLDKAKTRTSLHAAISPSTQQWVSAMVGGLSFAYTVRQQGWRAELYIDRGAGPAEHNARIFETLHGRKAEIERTFGGPLGWEDLEGRRACRIRCDGTQGGYRSAEDEWPGIQEQMVDAVVRLEAALKPYLHAIPT